MLLAGSAAAAVAGGPALAAAPKAATQGPGVYRIKLGDYQLTALYDGLWPLKIDDKFVRNADDAAVNEALAAAFLPPNILPVSFTVLLVNTGSKLILIDAGTAGQIADTAGFMMANLAAAGIAPAAIDTILISHFHPDHIDGLKTKDGEKVFRQRRNCGAGAGMGLLDGRRRNDQGAGPHQGLFPQRPAHFRRHRQGCAPVQARRRGRARHHVDPGVRPYAGAYRVRDRLTATSRCW